MRILSIDEINAIGHIKNNGMQHIDCFDVNKVEIDSRKLKVGSVFLPIHGENFNGHDYIVDAVNKGASFSFCELQYFTENFELLKDMPLLLVEDTLEFLQMLAAYIIKKSKAKVVAITGSTGKTTTKDFIALVLSKKYRVAKTLGNFNNHIGLPLTVLSADETVEVFVLEMGMNHYGEIKKLVDIAKPHIAVITNIGTSHIEYFGSQEGILEAKMEIASQLNFQDILMLNGMDDRLRDVYEQESIYKKMILGLNQRDDYTLSEITPMKKYCFKYDIRRGEKTVTIDLSVPGKHNVYNSAFALMIGEYYDVPINDIQQAIAEYHGEKMRLDVSKHPKGFTIINDAYNASLDSMKSSFEMIKNIEGKKKIIFLGDILEMGEYAIEGHRLIGEYIDLDSTDLFISIGDMASHIGEKLIERGFDQDHVVHCTSFDDAAVVINRYIDQDDVILIKASRGMAMEKIIEKI